MFRSSCAENKRRTDNEQIINYIIYTGIMELHLTIAYYNYFYVHHFSKDSK